jgi:hypothetical protein
MRACWRARHEISLCDIVRSRLTPDILNGQIPFERVKFRRAIRDVYTREACGPEDTAASEAEQ